MRRHIVITGTGRSGTTFLVELLTHLGLDMGFCVDELDAGKHPHAHAGLEHDIRDEQSPFIVKSPWFGDYAGEVLSRRDIVIEQFLIPMRDLYEAAESRRAVAERASCGLPLVRRVMHRVRSRTPGGLWHTRSGAPGAQEAILLARLYELLLEISGTDRPVTLMRFPRLVTDCAYLFAKLRPILPDTTYDSFAAAFRATARPHLVHSFATQDNGRG